MKPTVRRASRCICCSLLLCCALVAFAPHSVAQTKPTTVPAPRPFLLATGTPERFWITQFDTNSKTRTRTFLRGQVLPAGDWQDLGAIPNIVTAVADMRGDLALLLDDGTWKRLNIGGNMSTGVTVPGTGPILAWGSSTHALLAIRAVAGGKDALPEPIQPHADPDLFAPPATKPTTRPTTTQATTHPATTQSSTALIPVLFQFERGRWTALANVPGDPAAPMALGALNQQPVVAIADGDTVTTHAWVNAKWADWGKIQVGHVPFHLCSGGAYCVLWTSDADNALKVWRFMTEKHQWDPIQLAATKADAQAHKTLAVAGDELRMLVLQNGAIAEQRYQIVPPAAGTPRGELSMLPTPHSNQPNPFQWLLQSFLFMLFMTVVIVVLYRRRLAAAREEKEDDE